MPYIYQSHFWDMTCGAPAAYNPVEAGKMGWTN